ncbi:BrnT family toxin [Streptomyces albidoflavus]|uniref:BrnT family toxin n=1 Tax=Streptomyces albidoflavus TaxID=1886 RepID=UPI003415283D
MDDVKSATNEAERGIPFEAAIGVFLDPNRIEAADDYGEVRLNVIGMVDGVVLHVTYTMRQDVCRIISVRSAHR